MADTFEEIGNGIFKGIELSEQEGRLRPKGFVSARAVDLHGKMFVSFQPTKPGNLAFLIQVDGKPIRAFMGEYVGNVKYEQKDMNPVNSEGKPANPNKVIAFTYPALKRTPGAHVIEVTMGKEVESGIKGKNDFAEILSSPPYTVMVTEGEEQ